MMKLSIILPTFNERETILSTIIAIKKTLHQYTFPYEIIISDDDSPDGTAKIIEEYSKKNLDVPIKLIVRKRNHGLGLAIKDAISSATGSIIVAMDADGNHDPITIPFLLKHLRSNDLVVASRFVRSGGMSNKFRYYPTKFVNIFFWMLGMPVLDATSGYYACRKKGLQKLPIDSIYYGYGDYHLRLVWFAQVYNWRICEVPTIYGKRKGGNSKSRLLAMLFAYTAEVFRLRKFHYAQVARRKKT